MRGAAEPARVVLGRAGDAGLGSGSIPDLPMCDGNSAPAAQAGSAPGDPNLDHSVSWIMCMDGHFLLQGLGAHAGGSLPTVTPNRGALSLLRMMAEG